GLSGSAEALPRLTPQADATATSRDSTDCRKSLVALANPGSRNPSRTAASSSCVRVNRASSVPSASTETSVFKRSSGSAAMESLSACATREHSWSVALRTNGGSWGSGADDDGGAERGEPHAAKNAIATNNIGRRDSSAPSFMTD